jgi:catalase
MTPAQQQLLFENTARAMGDASLHIKQRHTANCAKADPAYGAGVAKALGINFKSAMIAAE